MIMPDIPILFFRMCTFFRTNYHFRFKWHLALLMFCVLLPHTKNLSAQLMDQDQPQLQYKYQKDILDYAPIGCPPTDAIALDITAFRWVHNPMTDDDFKTHINLGKTPPRHKPEAHEESCKRCGLSMYTSVDYAQKKYNAIKASPYVKKHLTYTHIAKGKITKKDGICTAPNKDGHFTLHEYQGANIAPAFSITSEIE